MYDSSIENTKYVGFYFDDTDLLEFSVDKNTNIIKKFQLVVCNHFKLFDEDLLPASSFEEGCIAFNLPPHNDCDVFKAHIYNNAVKIILSSKPVCKIIKCGQVLFGLSKEDNLVDVSVAEMSAQNISHTIKELSLETENEFQ